MKAMKRVVLAGMLAAAFAAPTVSVWAQDASKMAANGQGNGSIGSVRLSRKVMVDGQPLAAGTYQLRVSADEPRAVVGQSPDGTRYVEFLKAGKVVGRELATVYSNADIATILKGAKPSANGSKVELLKGDDYLRVWVNRGGSNYLLHLPVAS